MFFVHTPKPYNSIINIRRSIKQAYKQNVMGRAGWPNLKGIAIIATQYAILGRTTNDEVASENLLFSSTKNLPEWVNRIFQHEHRNCCCSFSQLIDFQNLGKVQFSYNSVNTVFVKERKGVGNLKKKKK